MVLGPRSLNAKSRISPIFPQPIALHFGGFVLIVSTDSHAAPPPEKHYRFTWLFKKMYLDIYPV